MTGSDLADDSADNLKLVPHSHLMKTSGDIASTSLYLLLIPINTNSLCVC